MKPIGGMPMILATVNRLKLASRLAGIVVATTDRDSDAPLRALCEEAGLPFLAGSEEDVLDRYYQTALRFGADPIVRVTSDCPFVDPELIDSLIETYLAHPGEFAYIATGGRRRPDAGYRYPHGLDAECFSFRALEEAWVRGKSAPEREHVTTYLHLNPDRFRPAVLTSPVELGHLRLTVDHPEDLALAEALMERLGRLGRPFGWQDIVRLAQTEPELFSLNARLVNPEGYEAIWYQGAGATQS